MKKKTGICLLLSYLLFIGSLIAQDDPEFPKGSIIYFRLHNGMITTFHSPPDQYVAGVQLVPQITIIPSKLRAGVIAGGFYANKKLQAALGPTLSWKLKSFNAGVFGTAGNLHLSLDHLWGTDKQRLAGGGLNLDLLNKLTLSITTHRDYNLNTWWIQTAMGIRISRKKSTPEPFNQ